MSGRIEAATKAGMRHYGYTDEQIEAAEQPVIHGEECEFYAGIGWSCIDESGWPIHAESVEMSQEFEMAEVHITASDAVMFSDEAVERAALALGIKQYPMIEGFWADVDAEFKEKCRDQARAVIAVLRENESDCSSNETNC